MIINFIPCPSPNERYKYPDIYQNTHEYIGNIPYAQYQVGDVLLFSNSTHEILEMCGEPKDYNWRYRRINHAGGVTDEIKTSDQQGHSAGVFRLRSAKVTTSSASAPVAAFAKVDDGFNDNCLRCGKRTYTGANKFEHQDGPCQAASGVVRR